MNQEPYRPEQSVAGYRLGEEMGADGSMKRELHQPAEAQYRAERAQAGGLGMFLAEMGEYELLTHEEEAHFARTYHAGEEAKKILDTPALSIPPEDQMRLNGIVKAGNEAKEVMITSNLRLVVSNAKKFRRMQGEHHEMEVLIGEGAIGLNRAVEKYDSTRGYKFSTYASWWIWQHMQKAATTTRTVRIPSQVLDSARQIDRVRKELRVDLGREPGVGEISESVGILPDKINELERLAESETTSLDADFRNSEDFSLMDVIEDSSVKQEFRQRELDLEMRLIDEVARDAILDERGWDVLRLRFGINETKEPQTLEAIAETMGLTRERVRQIQKQAELQLKNALTRRGFSKITDFS